LIPDFLCQFLQLPSPFFLVRGQLQIFCLYPTDQSFPATPPQAPPPDLSNPHRSTRDSFFSLRSEQRLTPRAENAILVYFSPSFRFFFLSVLLDANFFSRRGGFLRLLFLGVFAFRDVAHKVSRQLAIVFDHRMIFFSISVFSFFSL